MKRGEQNRTVCVRGKGEEERETERLLEILGD